MVAIDLKGFNDSDKPISRHSYQPQQICEELSQFIKCLGCHSATIIAHDLGALVGLEKNLFQINEIFNKKHFHYLDGFLHIPTQKELIGSLQYRPLIQTYYGKIFTQSLK